MCSVNCSGISSEDTSAFFLQIRVHAARRSVWFHSFSPRSYAECSQADSSDHFTSFSPVWNLTLLPGGCGPRVFRSVLHAAVSCNPVFISVRVLSKEATVLLQAGQLTLQCRRTKVVHASNVCMNPHYYMLWYLHSVVVYKFPHKQKIPGLSLGWGCVWRDFGEKVSDPTFGGT